MAGDAVRIERNGPVFTVLLSRPDRRNAVDGATAQALADAFREFDSDQEAAVAVLHGEGGVFCAGADLKAVGTAEGNRVASDGDGPMGPSRMQLSKPVIAAVAGHAVAGGLELALWCDLRVAEESAVFGVFCRRWGVPLIDGGTVRLPRLIGQSRAMDMILTGRPVDAHEARDFGLVNRVVADGESRQVAEALAAEIAQFPQTVHARGPAVGTRAVRAAGGPGDLRRARARDPLAGRSAGRGRAVQVRRRPARRLRVALHRPPHRGGRLATASGCV